MNLPKYVPPAATVRELISQHARLQPNTVYAVFPETQTVLTYQDLEQEVQEYVTQFHALGLVQGDTVSFMMGNGKTALMLFLSALYTGLMISPLNPAAGPEQIAYVLQHSDTKVVFISAASKSLVLSLGDKLPKQIQFIDAHEDHGPSWTATFASAIKLPPITGQSDALLMYTSGTTGQPKGVVLTHENLIAGGMNTAVAHELTDVDRGLCVLPLCHINAQCVSVMACLVSGSSLVLPHGFSTSRFWTWVVESGCSWFSVVPTIISYLMHQTSDGQSVKLESAHTKIRFGRSASAPLAVDTQSSFEKRFGVPIIETMGLTETAAQILSNPLPPGQRKIGSPGIAFGNKVKIVLPNGDDQINNTIGEIAVKGPNVMLEYLDNYEASQKTFTNDGWLLTGDLGYIDNDGYVFVSGRLKELIIKGGENISPREIDDALYAHKDVIEAAAFAIQDLHYGQDVAASVVLAQGKETTEAELIAFCKIKLGPVKTPIKINFLHDLPKGPSGKVQRLKLAQQMENPAN